MKKTNSKNQFWGVGENKNFGKVAIEYASGKDVILDQHFIQFECLVNEAHQIMLYKVGLMPKDQTIKIIKILEEIKRIDKKGKFILKKELEDVHSNIERYITSKLGIEIGGNLRLGIARNDQVYTDTRMFLREKIISIGNLIIDLINNLNVVAKKHTNTIMPGYTHSRVSQTITYAHWLTAKSYHFLDDLNNLLYDYQQVNLCPLGIFEMAGTHLVIDRKMTAKLLGFDGILKNSLYAANTRGEIETKILADLSIMAMHIKRTMQEIILWSTHEFGFVQIDDLYTTGGTAQPNLKNPDTLEIIRANCARIYGKFLETLITMDGLLSGYNRDTQQTKAILFESLEIIETTLPVFTGILTSLKINEEVMLKGAEINFPTAPDLSVQIAIKGRISFREAFLVVKALIKEGHLKNKISELTPELILKISKEKLGKHIVLTQKEIDEVATPKSRVFACKSEGGPAPESVKKMIEDISKISQQKKKEIEMKKEKIKQALKKLTNEVQNLIYIKSKLPL